MKQVTLAHPRSLLAPSSEVATSPKMVGIVAMGLVCLSIDGYVLVYDIDPFSLETLLSVFR